MKFRYSELIEFISRNQKNISEKSVEDFEIIGFSSVENCIPGTVSWMKHQDLDWDRINSAVIICDKKLIHPKDTSIIFISVDNPRLVFSCVVKHFVKHTTKAKIEKTVRIGENVEIGENVSIGHYSIIGDNVRIGRDTMIRHHVVINDNTHIGDNCLIKSGSVIGEKGFGFEYDDMGIPHQIPHIGKVVIGNNVEIGALNTVVQGTLSDTIIKDNVKTDDHVHIAHNLFVDENSLITACTQFSGGVKVGKNVWIGPNSSIIQKVKIADKAIVGIGSVIIRDVEKETTVAGNPARIIEKPPKGSK